MKGLLSRAILAFLALPGVVAFVIPLVLLAPADSRPFAVVPALIPLGLGVTGLLWCVREFYVAGRGTLAPWAPPKHLVTTGLYRWSRNPMYIAVVLVLSAWALAFSSWSLAVYAVAVTLAFHLRVVLHEEPWLARMHGDNWVLYKAHVPRWLGTHRRSEAR